MLQNCKGDGLKDALDSKKQK